VDTSRHLDVGVLSSAVGSAPALNVRDIPLPGPSQEQASPPSLPAHLVRPGGPGEDAAAGPYVPPSSAASAGVQTCRTAVLPLADAPAESEWFQADKRARLRHQREQMINGF
jgi:hypothetical protein